MDCVGGNIDYCVLRLGINVTLYSGLWKACINDYKNSNPSLADGP